MLVWLHQDVLAAAQLIANKSASLQCTFPFTGNSDGRVSHSLVNWQSCAWSSWECGAMTHFSFFHNVQHRGLNVYNFQLWDFDTLGYDRYVVLVQWIPNCIAGNTGQGLGLLATLASIVYLSLKTSSLFGSLTANA